MVTAIVAGHGGTGKTSQLVGAAKLLKPTAWSIMEFKDTFVIPELFKDTEVIPSTIITIYGSERIKYIGDQKAYDVNPIRTLENFEIWTDHLFECKNLKCVVIDGISDLRRFAMKEWIYLDNAKRLKNNQELRTKIAGKNITAWTEINERVRELIEPLVNYCIESRIHLFMTAEMKDVYEGESRIGERIDVKEWLEYPVECLFRFYKDGTQYFCDCEKVPLWTENRIFEAELVADIGFVTMLKKQNLLR